MFRGPSADVLRECFAPVQPQSPLVHFGVQNTLGGHLLRDPETRFASSPNHFRTFLAFDRFSQESSISTGVRLFDCPPGRPWIVTPNII